jgi:tetratricopeptide (TPR) repeat protein
MTRVMIAAVLALALAEPARADDADDKAKAEKAEALFKEGKRHFDIGEYAAAITSWKESYLMSGAPLILYNIGQAYRLAGNCAQANRFYLNYKRAVKTADKDLEKNMAKCAGVEPATGDEKPEAKPVDVKMIDDPSQPTETKPVETKPVETKPVETKPPQDNTIGVTKPVDKSTGSPGKTLRVVGGISIGVGGAFELIALLSAMTASSKANAVAGESGPWSQKLQNDQVAGQNAAIAGRAFAYIGTPILVTGVVLFFIGRSKGKAKHVEVGIAPGGAQVSYTCGF